MKSTLHTTYKIHTTKYAEYDICLFKPRDMVSLLELKLKTYPLLFESHCYITHARFYNRCAPLVIEVITILYAYRL